MADKKISALTAATTPLAGTEVLPIVQSGATVKVSIADVTAGRAISATSITTGAGAVGTPAYTFSSDFNTGMWAPAADTIAFSTAGSERLRVTSTGNFGIGISSPAARLDVAGNIFSRPGGAAGAVAELTADASSGANGISLIAGFASGGFGPIRFVTSTAERMCVSAGGNVGINEIAPDYRLDVNGAIGFTPGASVTPVDNGDVVFELTNNTTLTVKAKGSDGVVRSATLTLA